MPFQRIEDYGLIGNLHTAALVGRNGSIDWLCLPHFDSPPLFNALLDEAKGGFFQITAVDADDHRHIYFPETNVLITRFGGARSVAQVSDFMPVRDEPDEPNPYPPERDGNGNGTRLIRYVQGVLGYTRMQLICRPAFGFASVPHQVHRTAFGAIFASERGDRVSLSLPCEFEIREGSVWAEFMIGPNQAMTFVLERMGKRTRSPVRLTARQGEAVFRNTISYWRQWVAKCTYQGRWREDVIRSLLALKLLTFSPSGAIIAAPTTSLPEAIGESRNWDYRYCWIRDAALTLGAFMRTGYTDEARRFMQWLGARAREVGPGHPLQIMYGIRGERELPESLLEHLDGYRGSRPVRVGNDAHRQFQLDIYGELLESIHAYNRFGWPISYDLWSSLVPILDWVADHWTEPDEGIWEVRGGRQQFVHSKLMAWNALAKGLKLADDRSFPASRDRWIRARDEIFLDFMERGWNPALQSFVQSYGSNVVDASLLQLLNIECLSPRDPRMVSTIRAIEEHLTRDSLVYRYDPARAAPDGLGGDEGTFTMCTFWLVEALTRSGRIDDARFLFERMLGYASPLGLYAEENGPTGELLGNFPQAFTHLALINAAIILNDELERTRGL